MLGYKVHNAYYIMHSSGGCNIHHQTTAFVPVIVEDPPVSDSVMPRITIYENDGYFQGKYSAKEINTEFHLLSNSSRIYVFDKMPPEPTWKP
jgi:hypothetical protein